MSAWFSWDPRKAETNLRKHGVSFFEAATVFSDPLAWQFDDDLERGRAILVGESKKGRILYVVFIDLPEDDDSVRIISARRATPYERRRYEEGDP